MSRYEDESSLQRGFGTGMGCFLAMLVIAGMMVGIPILLCVGISTLGSVGVERYGTVPTTREVEDPPTVRVREQTEPASRPTERSHRDARGYPTNPRKGYHEIDPSKR